MKRINLKILLVVLLGMVCSEANAYVFSANYQGNAIYYNISTEKIYDYCNGLTDLRKGIIRQPQSLTLRLAMTQAEY